MLAITLVAAAANAPEQPLPFSHRAHAGAMKLECRICHTSPNPGQTEGIRATPVCVRWLGL